MKFLSFIVPMYNVASFLPDCLDSLVYQNANKSEYEIVLVDDGSTDNTVEIAKKYVEKYENIKLIQKENGGVSSARNRGIEEAVGEYIWFIDSDDFIKANCLGGLFKSIKEKLPEFIIVNYGKVKEEAKFKIKDEEQLVERIYKGKADCSTVCMTIIKSDIIKNNNIRFKNGLKYGEDTLFQHYVYIFREGILPTLVVSTPLYFYRQRKGSSLNSTTKKDVTKHVYDYIEMASVYKNDYESKIVSDEKMLNETKNAWGLAVEGALTILPKSDLPYKEFYKILKEKKLLPYPSTKWKLKLEKGFKNKVIRLVKHSFRYKFIYKIIYTVLKFKYRKGA